MSSKSAAKARKLRKIRSGFKKQNKSKVEKTAKQAVDFVEVDHINTSSKKINTLSKSKNKSENKIEHKKIKRYRLTFGKAVRNSWKSLLMSAGSFFGDIVHKLRKICKVVINLIDRFGQFVHKIYYGAREKFVQVLKFIKKLAKNIWLIILGFFSRLKLIWRSYRNKKRKKSAQIVKEEKLRKKALIDEAEGRIVRINSPNLLGGSNFESEKNLKSKKKKQEKVQGDAPISRALVLVPSPEAVAEPVKSPKTIFGKFWSVLVVGGLWIWAMVKWSSRTILRILLFFILLAAFIGGGVFYYLYTTGPDVSTMMDAERIAETTVIYDKTGETVLYQMHGEENRKRISSDDIPEVMRQATIAAEDDAFYSHFGIDPFSIARALKENLLQGQLAQGGSTITQQLARNVFLTRDKTLERKVREAVLAIKIERNYSKKEILDAYLNVVPYGMNAYGIQAASEIYFGKDARDLTLDEAAVLASLPKATTTFSPYGNYTHRLIARQNMILERMRELDLAPVEEIDEALSVDTLAKIVPFRQSIIAPHFVFAVIEELEKKYGRELLERGGFRVITTIDLDKQAIAEDVVARGVARNLRWGAENAALVAINPRTGEIISMVGSKDYYASDIDGQVNVATRLRQPGSAFKPLAYASAFEKGYQPETLVWDLRTSFGSDGSGKEYIPGNYTGRFNGLVSLRSALAQSLNVPAVKTLYLAGIDRTIELAHRMGITSLNERNRYGLALVLGGAEVKLVDLTAAYGVFANDGMRAPMRLINSINSSDGIEIYNAQDEIAQTQVLRPDVARKINSILSDNVARTPAFGRSNPLVVAGHRVAAKTGTTQNYRDAWTVGYTPELVVGVWAGNNSGRYMYRGAAGTYAAAPIWNDFMMRVLAGTQSTKFKSYQVVKSNIPMVTGSAPRAFVISKKSKKKEKKVIYHSILYYIDKNRPLTGAVANHSDPMLRRWEAALFGARK